MYHFARKTGRALLTKKALWIPSWRGWLLLLLLAATGFYWMLHEIHPFLALHRPVVSKILIVEGWVPDYALKQGLDLSLIHSDRYLLLCGGVVRSEVAPEPGDTYARMALKRLHRIGGKLDHVRAVPAPDAPRDRTYASALAVKQWIRDQGIQVHAVNIVTMGAHARRSRLLYQEAFGDDVTIGVIPVQDRDYDPMLWWKSSEGVKEVLSECSAFFYARFLFQPW
jgi:hypothetical protein